MELNLELLLQNIYGGDGFEREFQIEETKLSRSKRRIVIRQDVGVPIESEKQETKKESKKITVNTFKKDDTGNYLLKLGGVHGKLWGAIRESGYILCEIGELKSRTSIDRIMKTVLINPQWVKLQDVKDVEIDKIPQILRGTGNSMIIQYYDVIPQCKANVSIKFPDEFKEIVLKMLRQLENMCCLNRRRGIIKILNNLELY